jgi:hypothetical protein
VTRPLTERVVATEIEIKAIKDDISEIKSDVKSVLKVIYWAIGIFVGAGAAFSMVLAVFGDFIKKKIGL